MARLIFVAGSGRSGTHLLGRTIASHRDVEPRIETPLTFRLMTHLATHQDWAWPPGMAAKEKILILSYRTIKALARKPLVMEKSHPSLWLAERLLKSFPDSAFLAVWREPEPTVASMLRHSGVLSWYRRLPANLENRFLGITASNRDRFAHLSIEEKCALRWFSHKKEIDRLAEKFPDNFLSIKYDDFAVQRDQVLAEVSSFLHIENRYAPEEINLANLDKWKSQLSNEQIQKIRNTIAAAAVES